MKKILSIVLALLIAALPVALKAEEAEGLFEGSVTAGFGVVDLDDESFKYGEYTGLEDDTLFPILDTDLTYNRDAFYTEFSSEDLGLESREIYLEAGKYGNYTLFVGYSETINLISGNASTPFVGTGGDNLTLPAGFVTGTTTSSMTITGLHDIDLETKRKEYRAGFKKSFRDDIDFFFEFKRDEKEGMKSIGGTVRTAGGGPSAAKAVILPEPVDYRTDEIRSSLGYSDDGNQIELEYYLSTFNNGNDSLRWENPFWDSTGSFTNDPQFGEIALAPDNRHYGVTLTGGLSLPHSTRVSAVAGFGRMEQDEDLLPYTINPDVTITSALPRDSAEARIDVTHLRLNVYSRPMSRLGLNVGYRYYETDNKTPRDLFLYVKNDTGTQATSSDSSALYNLPYDYTQNKLSLDGSYYIFRGTTVKLGYDHDVEKRSYREADESSENTYRTRVSSNFSSAASAAAFVSYGEKRIDGTYEESALYELYHSEEYVEACNSSSVPDDCFDNHDLLRKFDLADRDRLKYGGNLTLFPSVNSAVGLYLEQKKDDYNDSEFGMTEGDELSYTLDVSYSPSRAVSLFAFYTREELGTALDGTSFTGSGPPGTKSTQAEDPDRVWFVDMDDEIDTFGIGASIGFMENKLTISVDYSYSDATGSIKVAAGSALDVPEDLPNLSTTINTFNATCKYALNTKTAVSLGYQYEDYESDDWATDGFDTASTTLDNVLTLSGSTTDYEAHMVMVFLTYEFGK